MVVRHGRYITLQLAEVGVTRQMFADILSLERFPIRLRNRRC